MLENNQNENSQNDIQENINVAENSAQPSFEQNTDTVREDTNESSSDNTSEGTIESAGEGFTQQSQGYGYTSFRPTYTNPYFSKDTKDTAQASYTFSNDASLGADAEPKKKKKKHGRRVLGIISLILVCIILAGGSGIGGAYILNKYLTSNGGTQNPQNQNQNPLTINNASNSPVTINKVEDSATESTTMTDVIASVRDTVVEIVTENIQESHFYGQYVTSGAGSGVIISSDGYIITNNHVIEGANSIHVRTTDGTEYEATTIGTDAESDVGIIKIEATGLKCAVLGNSDDLKLGEEVIAIGNPLGSLGGTVTNGIISALNREITIDGNKMLLLQTNAAVNPGNSGGGLFNMKGHLIGIVNAKSSSSSSGTTIEGLGFAIPINHAQNISADLIEYGYVRGKVSLGITYYSYDKDYTYTQGWKTYVIKAGVYVEDPGKNTELKKNDRFVSIDGITVSNAAEIKEILSEHEIGDTLEATVARVEDQKETIVTVTLTCYEFIPDNSTAG